MSYINSTIQGMLSRVESGEIILPAIQRDFVWNENKILSLFDSLMKQYPIGAFLFWQVSKKELDEFVFNSFIKDLDIVDDTTRGERVTSSNGGSYIGVLDGQQRITSLYIGLEGSLRDKVKKDRKEDGKDPVRYLALNLLHDVTNASEDNYEFAFLSENELASSDDENHIWFRVSNIMSMDLQSVAEFALEQNQSHVHSVLRNLNRLLAAVKTDEPLSYYLAENRELSDVVEIFERVNNNGQSLKGTDLMLSMSSVIAGVDMQKRIVSAISQVESATSSSTGFKPDKEFILTAALMATNAESISTNRKDNYRPAAIQKINGSWEDIIDAICNAAYFVEKLGFNGQKLKKTYLHPIVFYFFKLGNDKGKSRFQSSSEGARHDRRAIKQWLLRATINHIFVDGSKATLLNIRSTMNDALDGCSDIKFPLEELRRNAGRRSLEIRKSTIEELMGLEYKDESTVLPLLTLALRGNAEDSYELDHLWPQSKMSTASKIKKADVANALSAQSIAFYRTYYNRIGNLQLLQRTPNSEKNDEFFDVWLEAHYPNPEEKKNYCEKNCIPLDVDLSFVNFEAFLDKREELLIERIASFFEVK